MKHRVILSSKVAQELRKHILSDRTKEQMAITLCGIHRFKDEMRFLARHLILLPPEAFLRQSSAYLEILPEVQRHVLRLAAEEGLSQIDWHSHPGESPFVGFSGIDNEHEKKLATYLNERIPGTLYASVVMNRNSFDARIWQTNGNKIEPRPIDSIRWGVFKDEAPCSLSNRAVIRSEVTDERFSRQVLAFGSALQERLKHCRIGIIGAGGLGGIVVEKLSRLGAGNWVIVDDDVVELSNLNRLPGSTQRDVYHRTPKVRLAQRNIASANPYARVWGLPYAVSDPKAISALKSCDILIVATDNHSSRLIANRLSVQYLIPLVHLGVNIDTDEERAITDISGEYVVPSLGDWCLYCAGIIDPQGAGWELADEGLRKVMRERGYIKDTPAPGVYHLNGVIASLGVSEVHNVIFPYKPLRRYLTYDALKAELLSLDVQPKDDCPICSAQGGVFGLGDLEPLPDYEKKEVLVPFSEQFDSDEPKELSGEYFPEIPLDDVSLPAPLTEEFSHDCEDP